MSQIIRPPYERGVNWGAPRRMIAVSRDMKTQLFIRGGLKLAVGARGFGREYHPTALVLVSAGMFGQSSKNLATGRISAKSLTEHAAEIDSKFGNGVTAGLDLKKTIRVNPDGTLEPLTVWPSSW